MTGEADDTSWLDLSTDVAAAKKSPSAAAPPVEDDWLDIKDANFGKTTLAFQYMIDQCMRGTDRVMACDGHYMAYRPYNRAFDKETNPRTRERFADFIAAGHYKHLGTYDEVQIYELLPGSSFRHDKKQYVLGQDRWADIRQAAKAACERKWSDYHDIMGGIATALKGGRRDPSFARSMWDDTVNQVAIMIAQMKGPGEREVNEGFTSIRKARGISKGGVIATLNSAALQQVRFK